MLKRFGDTHFRVERTTAGGGGRCMENQHTLPWPPPLCSSALFGFVLRSAGVGCAAANWKIECDIKLIKTALCVLIFLSSFN